jgi:2-polyprenyl-3-methyl-5-hydroxy-6-metoxy-1,4-benzoquinol methylase
MTVPSPITGKLSTKLVDTIRVEKIVELYKRNFHVDVDDYFKGLTNVEVYECTDTGFRFYYPLSLAGTSEFYERLSSGSGVYYPYWKWENEVAIDYIPEKGRLLDVGCGDGKFLSGLAERKKGIVGTGLELNPDALKKCKEKGLAVFESTIEDFIPGHEESFDVVTSFQVVEHIAEIRSFLDSKLKVLKPKGTMIIGVPYSNPYLYKKDKFDAMNLPPHHMGLWNEHAFKNLEPVLNVKLKDFKIAKVHDMLYYFCAQLNFREQYDRLFKTNSAARGVFRCINFLLSPLKPLVKGHDIIAIFEKN